VNGDLGCFEVRGYAVNWLLRSDLGEVIKTIVADQAAFPDYQVPKETTAPKKAKRKSPKREMSPDLPRQRGLTDPQCFAEARIRSQATI
jgi:hypothetical protein